MIVIETRTYDSYVVILARTKTNWTISYSVGVGTTYREERYSKKADALRRFNYVAPLKAGFAR